MKSINHHKIRQVLASAHEQKAEANISDGWQADVMRRIRNLQTDETDMLAIFFSRMVWRFAVFASVLIVVLTFVSYQSGFQTEYELARLFIEDPLNVSIIQSFGI